MAVRKVEIEWAPGRRVGAILEGTSAAGSGVLLAHGAGAGQEHPFMSGLRSRLAAAGLAVLGFDYPYVAEGRKAPDRPGVLLECHRAAAERLAGEVDRIVFAGKSMGGRIGSHVAGFGSSPRVFYGYPLVAMGKREPRDTGHLRRLDVPMLFLQGARDPLAPLDLIERVAAEVGGTLEVIPDADHSFRVPKAAGITPDEMLDRLATTTVEWLATI